MSDKNRHLSYHGHYDNDEEYDISAEQQQKGKPSVKLTSGHADIVDTTNINDMYDRPRCAYTEGKFARDEKYAEGHEDKVGKTIPKTGVYAEADEESYTPIIRNPASSNIIYTIDTLNRPANTITEGGYAKQGSYASGESISRAGYIAEAGVGRARAEAGIFEAEAKGPNASFGAEASLVKLGALARAEIASASAKAGPVGVKVGLGLDTGASVGLGGVEVKVLGTGFKIGPEMGIGVLGNEVECSVM